MEKDNDQEANNINEEKYADGTKLIGSTKELVASLKEQIKDKRENFENVGMPLFSSPVSNSIPIDLEKIEKLKEIKESYGRFDLVGEEYLCRISADKLFELFLLGDKKEFHLTNRADYPTLISCSSTLKEKNIYIFINLVQNKKRISAVYDEIHPSYITLGRENLHGAILGKELKGVSDKIENFFNPYYKAYLKNGGNTDLIDSYSILNDEKEESFLSKVIKKFFKYFGGYEQTVKECLNDDYIDSYILNKNTVKIIKIYG